MLFLERARNTDRGVYETISFTFTLHPLTGKREIKALKVKCIERNCQWKGTVGTLEAHVARCEFTLVPCPKQCKDSKNKKKYFMRKDLNKHLKNDCPNRDYKCEYCGEKGTYAHITQVHDKICKQKILFCPNKCTKTMPRQDIEEHVELECEYTVIACKFKKIGCTTEMKRGDMAAHEQNDSLHLRKALNTVVELQDSNTHLQDSMTELQVSNTELREKVSKLESAANTTFTFKLTKFQEIMDSDEEFTFPSFYTSPGGYHMTIRVDTNGDSDGKGTHVSVFAPILEGKYDTELRWPFLGKVTFTLLNQLEDNNHQTRNLHFDFARNAGVGSIWGFQKFISHSELTYNLFKNTQYLKDDTLYFKVSVEDKPWPECAIK